MKQLKKVYLLHFVYEFEDGHENIILLGVFSSRIKAKEALLRLKSNYKIKPISKYFVIDENTVNRMRWEEGFTIVK